MKREKIYSLISLVLCLGVMLLTAAIKDHKVLGHQLGRSEQPRAAVTDTVRHLPDGSLVVSTAQLARDIKGYGGEVPLEITVNDGKITAIKALRNDETPEFFAQASQLLQQWKGKTLDEAATMRVDAVTGATYSSRAIIGNVKRGVDFARRHQASQAVDWSVMLEPKSIVGLIVALMAASLPLWVKNRRYRIVQQVLNVAVLGFWCGTLLSTQAMIGFAAGGLRLPEMAISAVMLVTAFLYPLVLGRRQYFCSHVCPFGSLQMLAGRCTKRKVKMKPRTVKILTRCRRVLWLLLMHGIWIGLWADWLGYDPFAAFMWRTASPIAVGIAVAFVALSVFVPRPYCRFVCPSGTFLSLSERLSFLPKK